MTLPISSQMIGMGKSVMGEKLATFKSDDRVNSIFKALPDSAGKTALENCIYIRIDLDMVEEDVIRFLELSTTADILLYYIWRSFCAQYLPPDTYKKKSFVIDEIFKTQLYSYKSLKSVIRELSGARSVFLHFDEFGAIERWTFLKTPPGYSSLDMYYIVWDELAKLMKLNFFVYCSGITVNLDLLGRNRPQNTSPTDIERIYLRTFSPSDIETILVSYYPEFNSSSDTIVKVADWLHGLTSGVPRSVIYSIEYLNKHFISLDKVPQDRSYSDQLSNDILLFLYHSPVTNTVPRLESIPVHLRETFYKCIVMVFQESKFPTSRDMGPYPLSQLVDLFGLITVPEDDGSFGFVCPLMWRKFLKLEKLGNVEQIESNKVNPAALLKSALTQPLLMTSSVTTKSIGEEFPLFREWRYSDLLLPEIIVRYTKKFVANDTKQMDELSKYEINEDVAVLLLPAKESCFPDLVLVLKKNNQYYLIAFQAKHHNLLLEKSGIEGIPEILEEMKKFESCRKRFPGNSLFIVANTGNYTSELFNYTGQIINSSVLIKLQEEKTAKKTMCTSEITEEIKGGKESTRNGGAMAERIEFEELATMIS